MSDPAISVENLSKSYLIGHQGPRESYQSLRDGISKGIKSFMRRTLDTARGKQMILGDTVEEFWALKNVSFEVPQGEVLGIIGRNGAGKSTLLKVLSRITEPTSGRVVLNGRVASLLEVGTGFHPELTGRENIFLNGAILGMSRAEIKRKFDEIVDFAGVEKFLDTPVKRYSSGMYVRLAFAVAAHLEPEILVVDEVLAVGDAEFQKKCMGKMQDVAQGGRTVLFVSHNMAAVSSLTNTCVYLKSGQILGHGRTNEIIQQYLHIGDRTGNYLSDKINDPHQGPPKIISIQVATASGGASTHYSGDELLINFKIAHDGPLIGACLSFQIVNQFQQPVLHCWIFDSDRPICRGLGPSELTCRIPRLNLNVGDYTLSCHLSEPPGGAMFESLEGVCEFSVEIVGRQTLFGWRAESCSYYEDYEWETPNS